MSEQIEQGDYIFYQDATIGGPPVIWDWFFPGGSPTGSSSQNPVVQYFSPNLLGYNASLYVEDAFALNSSTSKNNIIVVTPENLSAIGILASPSSGIGLSQNVQYTGTGPTGKLSYYQWILPGTGSFSGTATTENLAINSWLALTGSELGSVNSTFSTLASLNFFSITGNSVSVNTPVSFVKCGSPESFNYLEGSTRFPSPTGSYVQVTQTIHNTSTIGLGGGGNVYLVSQPSASNVIDNSSSHVQGEVVDFWSCSSDFNIVGFPGYLQGTQFVASKTAFDVLGVSYTGWQSLTRYTLGNYMFPNDISTYFNDNFYIGDVGNNLGSNTIQTDVGISNFIDLFFEDSYYASQSSVSITGTGLQPVAFSLNLDGANGLSGGFGLQCLPSRSLAGSDIKLTLTVESSTDGTILGYSPIYNVAINVTISDAGSPTGNSPDGTLIFAQDTGAGSGFVSKINSAISAAGFSSAIEAFAGPDFCYKPGLYSGNEGQYFQGFKLVIKDNVNPVNAGVKIVRVRISSNSSSWTSPYNYPVAGSTQSLNWLGLYNDYISNPYQEINQNKQAFRGFIFVGNS